MNKLSAHQVDKLIELIKQSPVIFDKNDKYYKLVSRKDKKWQDISNIVGADENECKTAWKSLRTQFVKAVNGNNRRSGSAEVTKTYKYFDKLLFLKSAIRPSKKTTSPNSNYDKFIEECDDPLDENDTDMFDKDEDSMEQIKPLLLPIPQTPRSSLSPGPSKGIKSNSGNHEDMKEFLDTIVTEIKSTNETQQDDTQLFFAVIGNMVRNAKLTRFQHRQIQKKVFNFVAQELDKLDTDEGTLQYPMTYN